jgi:hypothetical protein
MAVTYSPPYSVVKDLSQPTHPKEMSQPEDAPEIAMKFSSCQAGYSILNKYSELNIYSENIII